MDSPSTFRRNGLGSWIFSFGESKHEIFTKLIAKHNTF
ncbi:hypothetical protein LEP1GSC194_2742 [Leptospira alstonii serovar Sichuan str. 79601]|uniref:Uncharacterized protein n=1 Tax=Leptospira alstonii serovar Sichuan str. 79601 TaxID=1218565 RepID=M6CH09_9LEPT|nr:hypothetical protein LEP1GSC194_2742 [Leptospira alstonii serovar Sichuan str. 79601]